MQKKFLLVALLIGFYTTVKACSCSVAEEIDIIQYNEYSLIFTGIVEETRIDSSGGFTGFKYRIEGLHKSREDRQIVWVYESFSCGNFPKIGERWLIFATKNGSGRFFTSMCTRSIRVYENTQNRVDEDLRFIKKQKNKEGFHVYEITAYGFTFKATGSLIKGFAEGEWVYIEEFEGGFLKVVANYRNGDLDGDYFSFYSRQDKIDSTYSFYREGVLVDVKKE